jgi:hypothetical protein
MQMLLYSILSVVREPGQLSRCSDRLRTDGRCSIPGEGNISLYFIASTPAVGPTQPPIPYAPRVKRQGREADLSPLSRSRMVKLRRSPLHIRLHGIVLNLLSSGTTLPSLTVVREHRFFDQV